MEFVFEIENLQCGYKSGMVAIEIEKLKIPFGKIVFIVGESGIGKSTILETLGLMNNTILSNGNTILKYCTHISGKQINLVELWDKKEKKRLNEFRLNNFSFIFQQNNLMRNFSVSENVAITRILQGKDKMDSIKKALEILEAIKLNKNDIEREVYELSGGQQQRIAFARAIVPDFTVLFGDEPTGNLDPVTACNVMEILKNKIRDRNTNGNRATAIIVSHSYDLAIDFGDLIVKILSKEVEVNGTIRKNGIINADSIFDKKDDVWWSHKGKFTRDELKNFLINNG